MICELLGREIKDYKILISGEHSFASEMEDVIINNVITVFSGSKHGGWFYDVLR